MQYQDFDKTKAVSTQLIEYSANLAHSLGQVFPRTTPSWQPTSIYTLLSEFYKQHHPYAALLGPSIIQSTLEQLTQAKCHEFFAQPSITYIVPIHQCNHELMRLTIRSLSSQIGVRCHSILIIDGANPSDISSAEEAVNQEGRGSSFEIIVKPDNKGVALARNTGMRLTRTEFFSWLDANDSIHPLRSLHGTLMLLNNQGTLRLNTSYSRVNLNSKKIAIRNMRMYHTGHSSFIAYTSIIKQYGYLCDLRYHEDTEYQQRLSFFNVKMMDSKIVDHFLDIKFGAESHLHLSGDTWDSVQTIENHPFLEGSYEGGKTIERDLINEAYAERYEKILKETFSHHFPCLE